MPPKVEKVLILSGGDYSPLPQSRLLMLVSECHANVYLWNAKISNPRLAQGRLAIMDALNGTLKENIQDLAGSANVRPW